MQQIRRIIGFGVAGILATGLSLVALAAAAAPAGATIVPAAHPVKEVTITLDLGGHTVSFLIPADVLPLLEPLLNLHF